MFQTLKPNSVLYVLHKDTPALQIGSVVRTTLPVPKWPGGLSQDLVIDITALIDGKEITYPMIPVNKGFATVDGTNIVLSDNKEEMSAEIKELKRKSEELVNSIEYHKSVITVCDTILSDLNPEIAERKQQQQEISNLKDTIREIKDSIALLINEIKPKTSHEDVGN